MSEEVKLSRYIPTPEEWQIWKDLEYYPYPKFRCHCPCKGKIRVLKYHKYMGIPNYINCHSPVWNKGLTKETDERVAKISKKNMGKHYHTEEERNQDAEKQIRSRNRFSIDDYIPSNQDTPEKREAELSYLVGYWMGDGLRKGKGHLGFSTTRNHRSLVRKVSIVLGKPVRYRYHKNSSGLHLYRETRELKNKIIHEIKENRIIKKFPWHFLTGFLDSDGWVSSLQKDKYCRVSICFSNTNMSFLLLVQKMLEQEYIPCEIKYVGCDKKPLWQVEIRTTYGQYVVSSKILSLTIDQRKIQKCSAFIRKFQEIYLETKIPICETFTSIQGEGSQSGRIQFFIRASGCDMRCVICDSKYSWRKGRNIPIRELIEKVKKSRSNQVCFTGGEMAMYRNKFGALVAFLRAEDFSLTLQTNGLHYEKYFDLIQTVAMDMKTPCTGEKSNEDLLLKLKKKDEIKTLISDMKDYEYSVKLNQITRNLGIRHVLQPCNLIGKDDTASLLAKYKWLVDLCLQDTRWGNNLRILPQMHVFLWGNKRGV